MIKKILRLLCTPIVNNSIFYLTLFFLFSISIIFTEYAKCSRMRAGLELFFDIYLLCIFISILPMKIRKYVKYTIFMLLWFLGITDMICYQTMGVALSPNVLQTWMLTDAREATEAVSSYASIDMLISPIALFFVVPLLTWGLKKKKVCLNRISVTIILCITLVSGIYGVTNKQYLYYTYTRTSDNDMEGYKEFDTMTREYLPIYRLLFSLKEISRFSNMGKHLLDNIENTEIESYSEESPMIVLIIGESYNKHHSALYGYEKNTTPFQKKLLNSGNLHKFNDVIASYNLTFKSFQNMLSLYSYEKEGKWYDYPLVMPIFRKAGYEVNLFSNQYCLDKKGAFSDFIEDMFINNKELSPHCFDNRNSKTHEFDNALIDDYLALCDTTMTRQLNIFHFIGIHAEFSKRYPKEWAKFKPSDYNRDDLNEEMKQILADYDNAIAYNDYVIHNIIKIFENKEAIILHVPDHGELVFDNGTEFGRNMALTKEIVKPQYDIPFWIYCTNKYKEKHKEIYNQISASVNKPFMTDDLPHLLFYLANIQCNTCEEERNLLSNKFNINRKRFIQENEDYDLLYK